MTDGRGVDLLVDDLFRRSAGEITASLVRRAGGLHLHAAEEAVQEAFVRALRSWPWQGVPDNPRGWLYRVAWRVALDGLEASRRRSAILAEPRSGGGAPGGGGAGPYSGGGSFPGVPPEPGVVRDDELALLLLCCATALPRITRVMLTLKIACGFSVEEIGAAFLARPATVAQRLVRARRQLREEGARPPDPTSVLLAERAPVVREVLYLLFTGGHAAAEGASAVRGELCAEAIRLGRLLLRHPGGDDPASRALLALFCLHAARLPARVGDDGVAVPLEEQDRSTWDRTLLAEGFHHLEQSARGGTITRYHLEAGVAAVHASAPSAADTDWPRIVELYDRLLDLNPSPVLRLNRAVALAEARGPEDGLDAVAAVAGDPALARYHLVPAVVGALHERLSAPERAAEAYRRALELAGSEADRIYLERRLERVVGTERAASDRVGACPEGSE